MLKTTHRAPTAPSHNPLPAGWTEHKAPTGHRYYYNSTTKQSTYTRPVEAESTQETVHIDYNATQGSPVPFSPQNPAEQPPTFPRGHGNFTGGRSYHDRNRRQREDRPKSKKPIPGTPWILVMTKFKRRFVHSTETNESFWKFPQDVMLAVIEMEREERETREQKAAEHEAVPTGEASLSATASGPARMPTVPHAPEAREDSDEYEEVEVTDDEGEPDAQNPDHPSKRPRPTEPDPNSDPNHPVEFNEDDIAYQLAAMASDYDTHEATAAAEEEDGLPLTSTEATALFKTLLDDININPYHLWDSIIENPSLVLDDRYTALPTTADRRRVFDQWAAERIQEIKAARDAEPHSKHHAKEEPVMQYLAFLAEHATPKLYWPEFRRKFRKEGIMRDMNVSDKEREKLYRDFVAKVKAGGEREEIVRECQEWIVGKREIIILFLTACVLWNVSTIVQPSPVSIELPATIWQGLFDCDLGSHEAAFQLLPMIDRGAEVRHLAVQTLSLEGNRKDYTALISFLGRVNTMDQEIAAWHHAPIQHWSSQDDFYTIFTHILSRYYRIFLQDIKHQIFKHLNKLEDTDYLNEVQECVDTARQLVNNMCATMPYCFGRGNPRARAEDEVSIPPEIPHKNITIASIVDSCNGFGPFRTTKRQELMLLGWTACM